MSYMLKFTLGKVRHIIQVPIVTGNKSYVFVADTFIKIATRTTLANCDENYGEKEKFPHVASCES